MTAARPCAAKVRRSRRRIVQAPARFASARRPALHEGAAARRLLQLPCTRYARLRGIPALRATHSAARVECASVCARLRPLRVLRFVLASHASASALRSVPLQCAKFRAGLALRLRLHHGRAMHMDVRVPRAQDAQERPGKSKSVSRCKSTSVSLCLMLRKGSLWSFEVSAVLAASRPSPLCGCAVLALLATRRLDPTALGAGGFYANSDPLRVAGAAQGRASVAGGRKPIATR